MKRIVKELLSGTTPFCCIQKQDSDELLILMGRALAARKISDIPRRTGNTHGQYLYDTISMIPFCQIRERGYRVRDGGEEILTIEINHQHEFDLEKFKMLLPTEPVNLEREIQYDTSEAEYGGIIEKIVRDEIGGGEGANFVIPRNARGKVADFSMTCAMTIFSSLLENDYGTYWKYIFYDTNRFFIGSTPERHLLVQSGQVKMNPISGTFRKKSKRRRQRENKKALLDFLKDQKEINELYMVVDEELKMMAKMCEEGGAIYGPSLKEMSRLIHTEYLLSGESRKDIFELFTDSMFAATVVGSPVESACKVIAKYSQASRRYYGSALMLVGRDENGEDFLDSPITIRTAEIDLSGQLSLSVGATLVKDSVAEDEILETKAKAAGVLSGITDGGVNPCGPPLLTTLANDDDIIETLARRNENLSSFWFFKKTGRINSQAGIRVTIIHNEDDFVFMLRHMLVCMGATVNIVRYNEYDVNRDASDITLLGPGPGNPSDDESLKIAINKRIAESLLEAKKPSLFICLGHQILCGRLGLKVIAKELPLQGSQKKIDLFGNDELVGFYNTFTALAPLEEHLYEIATLPGTREVAAIRGPRFLGYQFHPESLLTRNGFTILEESLDFLVGK